MHCSVWIALLWTILYASVNIVYWNCVAEWQMVVSILKVQGRSVQTRSHLKRIQHGRHARNTVCSSVEKQSRTCLPFPILEAWVFAMSSEKSYPVSKLLGFTCSYCMYEKWLASYYMSIYLFIYEFISSMLFSSLSLYNDSLYNFSLYNVII